MNGYFMKPRQLHASKVRLPNGRRYRVRSQENVIHFLIENLCQLDFAGLE